MLEILLESNLDDITAKSLRQRLEKENSKNYSEHKSFFVESINECLEKKLKSEDIPVKEDSSQDLKLAIELQKQEDELSNQRVNLRRRASGISKKYQEGLIITPSKKKKLSEGDTPQGSEKPKGRVLNKPLILSSEMSAVFDDAYSELARPDVVKKLWDYIKLHQLQDPADKRFILCDEKLLKVFNKPRINCFKMAKCLSAHLYRKEDVSREKNIPDFPKDSPSKSSPKKQKMSSAVIDDSDEEASDIFNEHELLNSYNDEDLHQMSPLLLQVPGVTADMTYSAVQAAILAYTQVSKLRLPTDTDLILVEPNSPIAKIMGPKCGATVHILDLIQRVNVLYSNK